MKKVFSMLLTSVVMMLGVHTAKAQNIDGEMLRTQIIKNWERAKSYTDEYLATMPADKYGARAVDSVRTFAEQMLHLAAGNISLASNGTGKARIFPGFNIEKSAGAQNKNSVTYYVNASYDYVIDGIKTINVSQLGEHVKRGNLDETRLAWIQKAFEHQTHHRGQCTIYIRLQGIKPPNERLF